MKPVSATPSVAPSQPPVIEVQGLRKQYGPFFALRSLNLTLHAGEFVSLFGPNGAGKTTLIRILAHLLRPTAGTVKVLGTPLEQVGPDIRRQLGVISHQTFLYSQLTGRENLRFYGRLFGVPALEARIEQVLQQVEMAARADVPVGTYSKGMAQRLAIARAILHEPRIILLDEPYSGLDTHAAWLLTELLRQLRDGQRTLLMTTHNLEQGLELSHRVCIQVAGKMVVDAPARDFTPASLGQLYREQLQSPARAGGQA